MSTSDEASFVMVPPKRARGHGGLPEDPPLVFPLPLSGIARDISALSARSCSSGNMEMYDSIVSQHLKRESSVGTILSDYDIISHGGSVHYKCKRCTTLNKQGAKICQGCEAGLIADTDMDAQIALQLQYKEAQARNIALQTQGPLVQARILTQEVMAVVYGNDKFAGRFNILPDVDFTMAATRFIQAYQENSQAGFALEFALGYTFVKSDDMESIRSNGLPKATKVCTHHGPSRARELSDAPVGTTGILVASLVPPLPEPSCPTALLSDKERFVKVSHNPSCTLPLAYAETPQLVQFGTIVMQLLDALQVQLEDFFMSTAT